MSITNGSNTDDKEIMLGMKDGYRASWWAYLKMITRHTVVGVIALAITSLLFPFLYPVLALWWITSLIIKILKIRSIKLFANQSGVWLYKGIFPWSKAVYGVRWHNIDEAVSKNTLVCWFTFAYPVWVSNRYTKSAEIYAGDISRGDEFAARINAVIGNHYQSSLDIEPITRLNGKKRKRLSTTATFVE